jgi:hypothetical protein
MDGRLACAALVGGVHERHIRKRCGRCKDVDAGALTGSKLRTKLSPL